MNPTPFVSGILVAAGSGNRMQGICKQLYLLQGKPVILHTIQQFLQTPEIQELIILCKQEQQQEFIDLCSKYITTIPFHVVVGGETRQDSVWNGIAHCNPKSEYYAIHDGVRPFVRPLEISQCIQQAVATKAATLGVPVKDTIKIADTNQNILSTPPRETLYAIQTPQIFQAAAYQKAMTQAKAENKNYTDDCQLMEQAGYKVKICRGSYENIKITTPEDLLFAEVILTQRQKEMN